METSYPRLQCCLDTSPSGSATCVWFLPKIRRAETVQQQAVTCLTEPKFAANYSGFTNAKTAFVRMSKKQPETDSPFESFSSEAARQRWELFHRAIAHAKESTHAALDDSDARGSETESTSPLLTLVR